MKKLIGLAALAATICLSGAAPAATLQESHIGSSCDGEGIWHFVNNQTARNAPAGTLTANFSTGVCTAQASHVNQSVQHFFCFTSGDATLIGASTNLAGKLVLSTLDCDAKCACAPSEEVCDGADNDCDGKIDEDLNCTCVPTQEICGDGVDNDCDLKIDEDCGSCVPGAELCDGADNDCDGVVDDGGVCG